jgi:sulfate transport system permease protein
VARKRSRRSALPGFGLSMGLTLTFLSLVVLVPLSMVAVKSAELGPARFWAIATSKRAMAAYGVTLGCAFVAALIDLFGGLLVAWVLVRYRFPGRRILDAIVDLPFAVPTAVSGIALTALYSSKGWLGRYIEHAGFKVAFTRTGIIVALAFVSLPFVIRTIQPVLEDLEVEAEESAATLGANRWTIFWRVVLPNLIPAALTGFALAFARAIGEYGSVVFISGNMPMKTEIATLLIMTKLEQFDYAGATTLAAVMLIFSFILLFAVNRLQAWSRARTGVA